MATIESALADLPKRKNQKQKNKGRKIGRNFRWDDVTHSMTKYRGEGRRARNKARRAAQRARWLQLRKERHGLSIKDNDSHQVTEDSENAGTGTC